MFKLPFSFLLAKNFSVTRKFIAVQTLGLYSLRIVTKGINFILAILLARWLGMDNYGIYTLAWAWIAVLTVLARFGTGGLLFRDGSEAFTKGNWGVLKGLLVWSFSFNLITSGLVAFLLAFVSTLVFREDQLARSTFIASAFLLPLIIIVQQLQTAHSTFKNIVGGAIPDALIQPLVFMAVLTLIHWFQSEWLSSILAMILYAVTTLVISIGLGAWYLRFMLPPQISLAASQRDDVSWRKATLFFLFLGFLDITEIRISTLLLGFLTINSNVAIYGVAIRLVDLLRFVFLSFDVPVTRVALEYFHQNDRVRLQRLLTRSVRIMSLIGLVLACLLVIFGRQFLLWFNNGYLAGYPVLVILILAELVNLVTGLSRFLILIGYEKITTVVLFSSVGLTCVLGFILIPRFGLLGAALAELASILFKNITLSIMVYKLTGLNPTLMARMPAMPIAGFNDKNQSVNELG